MIEQQTNTERQTNSEVHQGLLQPIVVWTVLIELVTVALRFGAGMRSRTATASTIGRLTFGLRIHHGYIGLLLIAIAAMLSRRPLAFRWLMIAGFSLLFSDLIHHFAVLWLIVGDPQFDLFY